MYWLAKSGINDDEIEKLLQSKSGTLRHELTQLHVIGVVPKIKFIKGIVVMPFFIVGFILVITF